MENSELEENARAETRQLKRNIQRFVFERMQRYDSTWATRCQGCQSLPRTPPEKGDKADDGDAHPDEITYQILVFVSKNGRLEVLISENDGYVIAIRPQPEDPKQKDGWFYYYDVTLPVHLFGHKNWKMTYNSGYSYQYVFLSQLFRSRPSLNVF
jgi:hypothetical protein